MNFNEFKLKHSDLICFFQIIEGDLKWIFAIMNNGNPDDNFEEVKSLTLGQIVNELETLDKSDDEQFLSDSDYYFLKNATRKRNYWCHTCYMDFLYVSNWENSNEYNEVCNKLENDWNKFSIIYKNVEQAKIKAYDCFRRD